MSWLSLRKNLVVLGIVLLVISFTPGSLLSVSGNVEEGSYCLYHFQCVADPQIVIEPTRYEIIVSFFIVSLEDSFRFIDGEPMENLTILFGLENISEYHGTLSLDAPGQYVIFITTAAQGTVIPFRLSISRSLPNFWVFLSSICILLVGIVAYLHPHLKARISIKQGL
jgi:hypothetical protein